VRSGCYGETEKGGIGHNLAQEAPQAFPSCPRSRRLVIRVNLRSRVDFVRRATEKLLARLQSDFEHGCFVWCFPHPTTAVLVAQLKPIFHLSTKASKDLRHDSSDAMLPMSAVLRTETPSQIKDSFTASTPELDELGG
jgi:hypothetical protein